MFQLGKVIKYQYEILSYMTKSKKTFSLLIMNQEKCNLSWHTYSDHLKDMLHEMMTSNELTDVTLVCDDKKTFKAHKIVLSACSSVFKSIIEDLPHNNATIYLRGIQHQEMESILEFMYLGVATFYQDRMNEFLNVAKNLEFKEISKDVEFEDVKKNEQEQDSSLSERSFSNQADDDVNLNIQGTNKQLYKTINGKYSCEICDYQTHDRRNFKKHVKRHKGVTYACNQCDYQATQQASLKPHIQSKHEGVKYNCDQCDFQGSWQHSILKHKNVIINVWSPYSGSGASNFLDSIPTTSMRNIKPKEGLRKI